MITLQMLDETVVLMNTEDGPPLNVRCFPIQPYTPVPSSFSEYPVTVKPRVLQALGVTLAAAIQNIKDKYNTVPVVAFIGTSGAATAAVIGQQDLDLCTFMHVNKDGDSGNSHRGGIRIGEEITVLECPTHFVLTDEHVSSGNTLAGVLLKVVKWYQGQVSSQHYTKYWNQNSGEKPPEASQQQLWDNLHIHVAVPLTCSKPTEIINTVCGCLRWKNDVTPELYRKIQSRIVSLSAIHEPELNVKEIPVIKTQSLQNQDASNMQLAFMARFDAAFEVVRRETRPAMMMKGLTDLGKTARFIDRFANRNPFW